MRLLVFQLQDFISIKSPSFLYTQDSSLYECVLFLHTSDTYFAFAFTSFPSKSFHRQFLSHCTLGTFWFFRLLLQFHDKPRKSHFFRSRKLSQFLYTCLLKSIGYRNCRYCQSLNLALLSKIFKARLFRTLCRLVCSYCLIGLYRLLQPLTISLYWTRLLDWCCFKTLISFPHKRFKSQIH